MRIFLITILSVTAINLTPAQASDHLPFLCPVDIACEPFQWDWIDNLGECEARKAYCLGINECWANRYEYEAAKYRNEKILPGYERCVQRNSR